MTATTIIGAVVIGFGTAFLFLGGGGIFRLPVVYYRLRAGTQCTTLGAFCTIVGVGIVEPEWVFKAVIVAVFILLTNPISAHALARASYKSGVPPYDGTVVDKCREFGECKDVDEAGGVGGAVGTSETSAGGDR